MPTLIPTRSLCIAALLAWAVYATPSWACSLSMPDPPPTPEQVEEHLRQYVLNSAGLVEVEVLSSSRFMSTPAKARVLRVYRGDIRPGTILRFKSTPASMCGADEMIRGTRGLVVLIGPASDYFFRGYLSTGEIAILFRSGILAQPSQ